MPVGTASRRTGSTTLRGIVARGAARVFGPGLVTHDAGFARAGEGGAATSSPPRPLVTRGVRSARAWRAGARHGGLAVADSVPVRKSRTAATPANRLLVLAPAARRRRSCRHG